MTIRATSLSRKVAATLVAALSIMTAATFGTRADGLRYVRGDGGKGLDAFLDLGAYDQVRLGLIGCRAGPKAADLQLGLFAGAAPASAPELAGLWKADAGTVRTMKVCFGTRCEDKRWEWLESSYGDAFFTRASTAIGQAPVDRIEVAVPGKHDRYVWNGDFGTVLRRICRRHG